MKLYSETSIGNFEFWSGAKDNAAKLSTEELNQVETELEELYSDGMSKTELNDLFWFEFETVLEWVGKQECEECGEIIEIDEACECQLEQ